MIVVDASIAVKWALEEPGREDALSILDLGEQLVAPELIFAELANAFRKKIKAGQATLEQVKRGLRGVDRALARTVPATELWSDAVDLSQRLDHVAYDCFYLALAMGGGTLVTADSVFVAKCQRYGLGTFVSEPRDVLGKRRLPASEQLPDDLLREVQRLAALVSQTFATLGEAADPAAGEKVKLLPADAFAPAFDSPAYRKLANVLRQLPVEQLASLVALGWLGRSYYKTDEWPTLLTNARLMTAGGFDPHASYFVAQMHQVGSGLGKIQTLLK